MMPVYECSECGWFGSSLLNDLSIECKGCDCRAWKQGSPQWERATKGRPVYELGPFTKVYGRDDDHVDASGE